MQNTIYIGTLIHEPTRSSLVITPDAAIGVSSSGIITFISHDTSPTTLSSLAKQHAWTDYKTIQPPATSSRGRRRTHFFHPGFIDTHTHASQFPNVGLFGNTTLLSWLEKYTFPLESSYGDLQLAQRIYTRVVSRALASGTTCAAYYATKHVPATNLLADICLAKGQRALVGRVCMDRDVPPECLDASAEEALDSSAACVAHCRTIDPQGALVRPCVTPRFAPVCSEACMAGLGQLASSGSLASTTTTTTTTKNGTPGETLDGASPGGNKDGKDEQCFIQTHISENTAELALVSSLFPTHPSYASIYDSFNLLTPRTILAHAIHLTPPELSLILTRESAISHCPTSNTSLTSGAARVRRMLDAGHKVGLGSDVSGGYTLNLLDVARQAMGVSRHVAMETGMDEDKLLVGEALYLATMGGARVVGLEDRVGSFEVGKEWDALCVCLDHVGDDGEGGVDSGVDLWGWESWEDVVAKWLYGGDDRNLVGVWVKGRLVHKRQEWLDI